MSAYARHTIGSTLAQLAAEQAREDTAIQPHITLDSYQRLKVLEERLRRFVEAGEAKHNGEQLEQRS